MKQSGMPSRRHMPSPGPVRLNKSDGQFSVKNILTKTFGSRVDKFTPGACLSATSTERPNMTFVAPTGNTCPSGYIFGGLAPSDLRMQGILYNNICIKNNYNTTDWATVANCCNGVTAAKDCDPSLCAHSQGCRDKMTSTTWCNNRDNMNRPECVTYLNADGNDDVKASILARNCTASDMAAGACRNYATSGKAHGQMDAAVVSWCTGQIRKPLTQDQQVLIPWANYRYFGGPRPFMLFTTDATMDAKLATAVAAAGGDINKINYPDPVYYNNSQDPICSCILSQLNKPGEKSPPVACFDAKCQLSGYQTTGMKAVAANCPSWVECRSNVLAASSGVVDNVKVTQTCGEPPPGTYIPQTPMTTPTPAPTPTSFGGVKDDKTLLKDDEARAAGVNPSPTIINTPAAQTLGQQLAAPFAPSLFGSASVAEVSILFFVMLILGAILYRSWMNRRATQLIQGQYEAALKYDEQQELADRTREIKESIATMSVR